MKDIEFYVTKAQDRGLSSFELACLINLYNDDDYSRKEIATAIYLATNKRIKPPVISQAIKLFHEDYKWVKKALEENMITYTHAITLIRLSRTRASNLLQKCVREGWNIKELQNALIDKNVVKTDYRVAEELFLRSKGVKIKIKQNRIIIEYDGVKQLTEIFNKLGVEED